MVAKGQPCYVWTKDEDELLVKYRTQTPRLTVRAVAKRLGRTVPAVSDRITHLQIAQRKKRQDGTVPELVRRHWRMGLSDAELGRLIRVNWKYVGHVRRKLGLPNGCDHSKKGRAGARTKAMHRPRCWGCNKLAGARSPQWCRRNGWFYESYRFRDGDGNQSENECYCPECWKLVKVYGMAGGSQPAGHSPPAGEPVKTPTGKSSPNRLACASGTG